MSSTIGGFLSGRGLMLSLLRHTLAGGRRRAALTVVLVTMVLSTSGLAKEIPDVVLVVHGGTGMERSELTPELEKAFREDLARALRAGYERLSEPGATSLDAVETAVRVLEDSPHFNAGKGAVFTHDGRNELDASIMEGRERRAGSVAGVTTIKNPITAARAVMEKTRHVMLVGQGADEFARSIGLEIVEPEYFRTERRWQQLQDELREEREKKSKSTRVEGPEATVHHTWGTVGAVALDREGDLAAATSTGGLSNKRHGRVGDSPIIGAGTYADNSTCGVSCTGHGEFFIRYAVAHEIASRVRYKRESVQTAADQVVQQTLKSAGGEGGVIVLDPHGRAAFSYNSEGLYRGYVTRDGSVRVLLYED